MFTRRMNKALGVHAADKLTQLKIFEMFRWKPV